VPAIRILHVIASLAERTGGPAKAAREMARAVARRGHEVSIYTTDRDAGPGEGLVAGVSFDDGGVAVRVFAQGAPRGFATSWPLARALDEAVAAADVVHIHSLFLFHVWAAARACRRHATPYLLRPHGTLDPFIRQRRRLEKRVLGLLFHEEAMSAVKVWNDSTAYSHCWFVLPIALYLAWERRQNLAAQAAAPAASGSRRNDLLPHLTPDLIPNLIQDLIHDPIPSLIPNLFTDQPLDLILDLIPNRLHWFNSFIVV
jgi:glycosyltransferase involved in cell wall biosynthesis